MDQKGLVGGSHRLAIFSIVVGVILLLSSFVGGTTYLIALGRGIVGRTLSGVRSLVLDIAIEFCMPLVGGITLIFFGSAILKNQDKEVGRRINESSRKKVVREKQEMINVFLNPDEKRIIELVKESKNGALQSDLVIKTGYSKVKMHRILKGLENKGLIKRGRFGITNKVHLSK
jgi:uncharacterized membrane protein